MCYFEQTRWICSYWKWGNFREQCNKEYRTGETCGLKLVYHTVMMATVCRVCEQIHKKQRRLMKMNDDVQRWTREGNRRATIEKTLQDAAGVQNQIEDLLREHDHRVRSLNY